MTWQQNTVIENGAPNLFSIPWNNNQKYIYKEELKKFLVLLHSTTLDLELRSLIYTVPITLHL